MVLNTKYVYFGGSFSYDYVEFEAHGVTMNQLRLIMCIDDCQTKVSNST